LEANAEAKSTSFVYDVEYSICLGVQLSYWNEESDVSPLVFIVCPRLRNQSTAIGSFSDGHFLHEPF
jgi:hypothetical protein